MRRENKLKYDEEFKAVREQAWKIYKQDHKHVMDDREVKLDDRDMKYDVSFDSDFMTDHFYGEF